MIILIFFIAHWYLSLFSQTFLMHRYAAHGAFQMSKFWERFFYVVAYITMGSSYLSPKAYAIMHRLHHAYTDQPEDPHSPIYYPSILAMMKQPKYIEILARKEWQLRSALKKTFRTGPQWTDGVSRGYQGYYGY